MSNLIKPYVISVWKDELIDGQLTEVRIGVIGANDMLTESRVLEPNLIRNSNGTKKMTFKMYKKYIDTITGEKVDNPFSDWLVAERKVKLEYEGKWYDFVVKDIVETSTDYLYQYSLEDALVQELSKNGFGVTFDAALMNNMGDVRELAAAALQETDWNVDSEIFVQTVDEALVYVEVPADTHAKHILDQSDDNLGVGVTVEKEDFVFSEDSTVLAFYSCCKNKPHRFQFIYSANGYDSGPNGYEIARKDDRTINQKNCQYYIDFENPNINYAAPGTKIGENSNGAEELNLWLPKNFKIGIPGVNYDAYGNPTGNNDSVLSSWYRGKRYGFAQQSVYVPLLERYCQKFERNETIPLTDSNFKLHQDGGGSISIKVLTKDENQNIVGLSGSKRANWSGYKIDIDYSSAHTYLLSYKLKVNQGTLYTIGGHNASFYTEMEVRHGDKTYKTSSSYVDFGDNGLAVGQTIEVFVRYNKFVPETTDWSPYIFIQPNRGRAEEVCFTISDLSLKYGENYLGYTESEFVSPTLIQNCINNYNFESTGGWTATSFTKTSSIDRPKVENAYGRFEGTTFSTITEDFLGGSYTEGKTYTPYMKMEFYNNNQFVLNSGIRDNRTMIQNMPAGEEWVLDYKIVGSDGSDANDKFDFSLDEYIYNTNSGGYNSRDGFIAFSGGTDADSKQAGIDRKIFTVANTSYDKETFKKNSKIYLKIIPNGSSGVPNSTTTDSDKNPIGYKFYIEKIALYRKTIGADGEIIIPDLEEKNTTAETFAETGTIEHKYHYFSNWLIDNKNPNSIKEKEKLVTEVKDTLSYETYVPVYNEGAKKIRSITAKESNYFNILQTIAETFEAWLDLEIEREADGAIKSKKVKFKNYLGNENYANFRYGVNLKDIQRTTSSKNIVTKLIVKQNSNELAENGFCTIRRAGANPTGENYIYDFQYYQNMGIMNTRDFLDTVYYIDEAQGKDGELWKIKNDKGTTVDGYVITNDTYNLNGYYPRIKKINDAILPISEELIGLNADLLEKKAKLEVEEATYEASITGIEQVREDFVALTGIYPEEAQSGAIDSVTLPSTNAVVPKEDWWQVDTSVNTDGFRNGISLSNNVVKVAIKTTSQRDEERGFEVKASQGTTTHNSYTKSHKFTKSSPWTGLYIENDWEESKLENGKEILREYVLTYEIEATEGTLLNIGCHNTYFSTDFEIEVKNRQGNVVVSSNSDVASSSNLAIGTKYFVTVKGKRKSPENTQQDPNLWIQPNRGETDPVTCIVSNIQLYKVLTGTETASAKDREAHFCLNVNVGVGEATIARTYEMTAIIPSNHTSGISIEQQITAIDLSRNDVQKYLTEYTTYYEKRESSNIQKEALKASIANKEASIKAKENRRKDLLEYKKQLNYLFFKKYSRFIQEGTWISEEYVDDDKYFADSQSVLYNSCYPQVGYAINVVALSALPGYEHFVYELGDKTNVIDEEFFGPDYQEEVIITEIAENLDDPSKNTIKVQNFKNQFQDLFQKITATVQQTQYNVGSYEKGAALVEANLAKQNEFITNAINGAQTYLNHGQTVKTGPDGITITDDSDKQNQLRLVGGAILFSTTDQNTQEQTWMTGVTKDGISANLITAGRLDAGVVQIMSGNEPVFRWDAYGISAYDALWTKTGDISTISGINTKKFVRFDKNGIYGINNAAGVDGASWHPDNISQIDQKATFALTWEGLKVTGNDNTTARIGRQNGYIMVVKNSEGKDTFRISNNGSVEIAGNLRVGRDSLDSDKNSTSGKNLLPDNGTTPIFYPDLIVQKYGKTYGYYNIDNYIDQEKLKEGDPITISFDLEMTINNDNFEDSEVDNPKGEPGEGTDKPPRYWNPDGTRNGRPFLFVYTLNNYARGPIQFKARMLVFDEKKGNTVKGRYSIFTVVDKYWINPEVNKNFIEFYSGYSGRNEFTINNIKLERGYVTEWVDSSSFNGNASWDFNKDKGLIMWGGIPQKPEGDANYGDPDEDENIVFKVGKKNDKPHLFMRGSGEFDGHIIAKSGKIGNMTIEDLNKKLSGNLIRRENVQIEPYWFHQTVDFTINSKSGFGYILNLTTPYENPPPVGAIKIEGLKKETVYTVSFKAWVQYYDSPSSYQDFKIQCDFYQPTNSNKSLSYCVCGVITDTPQIFSGQLKISNDEDLDNYYTLLRLYCQDDLGLDVYITDIQLELGETASDWAPPISDSMQANVNGNNFSWKFSPTEGMYMWNGPQSEENKVFSVTNNALTMRGAIVSETQSGGYKYKNQIGLIGAANEESSIISSQRGNEELFSIAVDGIIATPNFIISSDSIKTNGGDAGIRFSNASTSVTVGNLNYKIELSVMRYNGLNFIVTAGIELEGQKPSKGQITSTAVISVGNTSSFNSPPSSTQQLLKVATGGEIKQKYSGTIDSYFNSYGFTFYLNGQEFAWIAATNQNTWNTTTPSDKYVIEYTQYSSSQLYLSGDILPDNGATNLGGANSTQRWENIYAKNIYGTVQQSDERVKNSIETIQNQSYEQFFDSMRPVRYKYNEGTSNRYHTGFIAQELVKSLEDSGLTTQDFAGVVLDHPGEEDECWYLRRDEFIALNTWQIQKLKPRVSSLEQTILDYETRISTLESEIKNLTNSQNSDII